MCSRGAEEVILYNNHSVSAKNYEQAKETVILNVVHLQKIKLLHQKSGKHQKCRVL